MPQVHTGQTLLKRDRSKEAAARLRRAAVGVADRLATMSLDGEEWRPITDWGGFYEVSNIGRVRRVSAGSKRSGLALLARIDNRGYCVVDLKHLSRRQRCQVHRLVMAAFVGSCPGGHEVNHIDAVRTNNHVLNLEYVTRLQNVRHAVRLKRHPHGMGQGSAKLTDDSVRRIRGLRAAGWSIPSLVKEFGVAKSQIENVIYLKSWTHVG